MSLQMALFAQQLAQMAKIVGKPDEARGWRREYERLKKAINRVAWDAGDGFYYDVQPDGAPTRVKHIGAYWSLLSDVADQRQVRSLVRYLQDAKHFYRPVLFPSLSASHPKYDPTGNYWVGGVWASTNYMVIKGPQHRGYRDLAREAAQNYIAGMARVLNAEIEEQKLFPAERDGQYRSIWECYAPEYPLPGTTWDPRYFSKHHFVGWSGIGPIALLLENVLGFDVSGLHNTVTWHLRRSDRHGVRNLPLGRDNTVDLVAAARRRDSGIVVITGKADRPFTLDLRVEGWQPKRMRIQPGDFTMTLRR